MIKKKILDQFFFKPKKKKGLLLSNTLVARLQPTQQKYRKGIQVLSEEKVGTLFYFYLQHQVTQQEKKNSSSCLPFSCEELEQRTEESRVYDEDLRSTNLRVQVRRFKDFVARSVDEHQSTRDVLHYEPATRLKKEYPFFHLNIDEEFMRGKKSIKSFTAVGAPNERVARNTLVEIEEEDPTNCLQTSEIRDPPSSKVLKEKQIPVAE